jgi:hypothetical protein
MKKISDEKNKRRCRRKAFEHEPTDESNVDFMYCILEKKRADDVGK